MAKYNYFREPNEWGVVVDKFEGTENCHITWVAFSGDKYGNCTFGLVIEDPEFGNKLRDENWNIKVRDSRDPDDPPYYVLPVEIQWRDSKGLPARQMPIVRTYSDGIETVYNESTVGSIDGLRLRNIDVRIKSRSGWNVGDPTRKKAICEKFQGEVIIDELDRLWMSKTIPDETLPF